MDFFEAVRTRRSVRKFKPEIFPDEMVVKALEAATLAPNSSNTQTWDFYWPKNPEIKKGVINACLFQSAARTASHLIVVTATSRRWRRSQGPLIEWAKNSKAHPNVVKYYEKLVPMMYTAGIFNILAPFKWLAFHAIGLFRPIMRGPITRRDIQEVSVKSAALACENFVLAITAQGGATCMMEGFDEWRMKKALNLPCATKVVMVIAVGFRDEAGIWGPQFRLPQREVVHVLE